MASSTEPVCRSRTYITTFSDPALSWQDMPYQGLALETTWQDNAGSEKVVMYVRDLQTGSVDEAMFSTQGYEVQDMTAMPMFGR